MCDSRLEGKSVAKHSSRLATEATSVHLAPYRAGPKVREFQQVSLLIHESFTCQNEIFYLEKKNGRSLVLTESNGLLTGNMIVLEIKSLPGATMKCLKTAWARPFQKRFLKNFLSENQTNDQFLTKCLRKLTFLCECFFKNCFMSNVWTKGWV